MLWVQITVYNKGIKQKELLTNVDFVSSYRRVILMKPLVIILLIISVTSRSDLLNFYSPANVSTEQGIIFCYAVHLLVFYYRLSFSFFCLMTYQPFLGHLMPKPFS